MRGRGPAGSTRQPRSRNGGREAPDAVGGGAPPARAARRRLARSCAPGPTRSSAVGRRRLRRCSAFPSSNIWSDRGCLPHRPSRNPLALRPLGPPVRGPTRPLARATTSRAHVCGGRVDPSLALRPLRPSPRGASRPLTRGATCRITAGRGGRWAVLSTARGRASKAQERVGPRGVGSAAQHWPGRATGDQASRHYPTNSGDTTSPAQVRLEPRPDDGRHAGVIGHVGVPVASRGDLSVRAPWAGCRGRS